MNLKIAHLVAIQFGIFVGTMSWLIYSRLPSPESSTIGESRGRMVNSIRPEAPLSELKSPRSRTEDYGADNAQSVGELQARTTERYNREIAMGPYANSVPNDRFILVNSPSYANVYQETAGVPSDYVESPQTVEYAQPLWYADSYPFVGYSNGRRFANRCRSTSTYGQPPLTIPNQGSGTPQFGPPFTIPNQRPGTPQFGQPPFTIPNQPPDRGNCRPNHTRVVSSPNFRPPSGPPPNNGFRNRGPVRQSAAPRVQPQRRAAAPASPGAARRFAP